MANELNITLTTGLTITASTYINGIVNTTGIVCHEVGSTGVYQGTMTGIAGIYEVFFYSGAAVVGSGWIAWDGTYETSASPVIIQDRSYTYSSLKAKIADYLSRSDLTAQIEDFIYQAEIRLRRELRIRQQLKVSSINTIAGVEYNYIPEDYNAMRDMHIVSNPIGKLEYKSPSAFYSDTYSQGSGQPRQYTIISDRFIFAPVPDGVYTVNMLYYALPQFLSTANTSNVFLVEAPDLLLYGALAEAEPYLMNDSRVAIWAQMYQKGLDALSISDDEGEYSGAPLAVSVSPR
jgi:hypothetical protein